MSNLNKKDIELDEVEAYYRILEQTGKYNLNILTSDEISEIINYEFDVNSTGRQVYILHEPTLEDMIIDSQIHYGILNNY